jgi:hypothetical protein
MTRIDALAEQVTELLASYDPDVERDVDGLWSLRFGSTLVVISVLEDGDRPYVRMLSLLLHGVRPQLEWVTRLLRLNAEVLFGAFQLFEDDTLGFAHTLLASPLDPENFRHALSYVARVGDDHDEELQALAGGHRVEDLLEAP